MSISYIGYTTTTLSRRLTMHLASGAIKSHFAGCHSRQLTRNDLTENTTIMRWDRDINRLQIAEALLILASTPIINRQDTGSIRILKLFSWLFIYFQSHLFSQFKKSFNKKKNYVLVFMIQLFIKSRFLIKIFSEKFHFAAKLHEMFK